jgi:hypothetical protein
VVFLNFSAEVGLDLNFVILQQKNCRKRIFLQVLKKMIFHISYLCADSIAHFYPVTQPVIRGLPYAEAEEAGIHENEILDDMVVHLVNKIESGRILILVKRLSHGDRLASKIPGSYWIKGEDDAETRYFGGRFGC